jgi:hypothetical protein
MTMPKWAMAGKARLKDRTKAKAGKDSFESFTF